MNALDVALRAKLLADTGPGGVNNATTGATGGFHQLVAPQKAGFPRFHFQELIDTALYSFTRLKADHVFYQFTVFAVDSNEAGTATSGRLAERARIVLTDPAIDIEGKRLIYSRFERSIPPQAEWDDVNNKYIYNKGFILELYAVDVFSLLLETGDRLLQESGSRLLID